MGRVRGKIGDSFISFALAAVAAGAVSSSALGDPRTREQALRTCAFDPVSFGHISSAECAFQPVQYPKDMPEDVRQNLTRVQQLLDAGVGAGLFYNSDLTEAVLVSCLDEATRGEAVRYEDWCAMFATNAIVSLDDRTPGKNSVIPHRGLLDVAGAMKLYTKYHNTAAFIPAGQPPEPGCLALYQSKDGDKFTYDGGHVAVVMSVNGNDMMTVDGNVRINPDFDKISCNHDGNHAILVKDRTWREKDGSPGKLAEVTNSNPSPACDAGPLDSSGKPKPHHMKQYLGCVRPWPPAPGEEKAWKEGLAALQKRYARVRGYDFLKDKKLSSGPYAFGACFDRWKLELQGPEIKMQQAPLPTLTKYLAHPIDAIFGTGDSGTEGSGSMSSGTGAH